MTKQSSLLKLQELLIEKAQRLRQEIDETLPEEQLITTLEFKKWYLSNLLIDGIEKNLNVDSGFNNLLYYIWEERQDVDDVLSQYELKASYSDEGILHHEVIIKEYETQFNEKG